jgi:hypothetical protein
MPGLPLVTRRATAALAVLLAAALLENGLAAPADSAPAPAPSALPPCIENPDGIEGDDGIVGGCRNCTTDGSNRCAVCWDFYTLTPEGTCALVRRLLPLTGWCGLCCRRLSPAVNAQAAAHHFSTRTPHLLPLCKQILNLAPILLPCSPPQCKASSKPNCRCSACA